MITMYYKNHVSDRDALRPAYSWLSQMLHLFEYFGGVPLDDGSVVHTLCPLMPVNVICGWQLLDQP